MGSLGSTAAGERSSGEEYCHESNSQSTDWCGKRSVTHVIILLHIDQMTTDTLQLLLDTAA